MLFAYSLDLTHRRQSNFVNLLICNPRNSGTSLCQNATGIRSRIEHSYSSFAGKVKEVTCRPVQKREAIMIQQDIERPVSDHRQHDIETAHCQPDGGRQTFLLHSNQFIERPAWPRDLVEIGGMLRVVKVQYVNAIETERQKTLLKRLSGATGVEAARTHVPV